MATALSTPHLRAVLDRLCLVEIDTLRGYERPDVERVAQLVRSMDRSGVLKDPIVIDRRRELVIDGHHRLEACRWLGLSHIPAFDVDYLAPAVSVAGWWRLAYVSTHEVAEAFRALAGGSAGPWDVSAARHDGQLIARRSFASARGAAEFQDRVARLLRAAGARIELRGDRSEPADAGQTSGAVALAISPAVDKREVLAASREAAPFPHQVNRHVVDGRPLGLAFETDVARDPRSFAAAVDALASSECRVVAGGVSIDGRYYEERTVVFDRGRE